MTATAGWNGDLYAGNTAHHRRYDDTIVGGLTVPRDASLLDLGCGVGDLTAQLGRLVPDGAVLGVDAAKDMVDTARASVAERNVSFVQARAQELDRVTAPGAYHAVVSVAVLHWIAKDDHPAVLAHVARALRPGGVLRADAGGAGQIARVQAVLDEVSCTLGGGTGPWYFPTVEEYTPMLVAAGLAVGDGCWVRIVRQRRAFDEQAFTGWLRSQVLIAYDRLLPADAVPEFRRRAEERALGELRRPDGSFDQDYVRLDLRVVLPISL